eukprot:gb/GECH01011266.1/.p1 GENE.gb/GECH01011266.1/~~gb/GECH01011266.1/.p1  ORF type:complete len:187 (+),score=30.85 gb/GECH01011266.1/:1-561(+)
MQVDERNMRIKYLEKLLADSATTISNLKAYTLTISKNSSKLLTEIQGVIGTLPEDPNVNADDEDEIELKTSSNSFNVKKKEKRALESLSKARNGTMYNSSIHGSILRRWCAVLAGSLHLDPHKSWYGAGPNKDQRWSSGTTAFILELAKKEWGLSIPQGHVTAAFKEWRKSALHQLEKKKKKNYES